MNFECDFESLLVYRIVFYFPEPDEKSVVSSKFRNGNLRTKMEISAD